MKKIILDDGFQSYLTEGSALVGTPGIPMLVNMHNTEVPSDIVPFEKCRREKNRRKYIHFYMHDKGFANVLTSTKQYVELFRTYDGVITPDCTMLVGQAPCLLQTNTYFNRAVGVYLQKQGIPVIPNIRWSDESSFEYCFLGVPRNTIVSVSTHGCIRSEEQKKLFRIGLQALIEELAPTDILVHGYMPESVFNPFNGLTKFHRYPSQFERTHGKEVE